MYMSYWPFRIAYAHHTLTTGDPHRHLPQCSPERKHNLRGPIPSRGHILCHINLALRRSIKPPTETEITYLKLTVRVYQQVPGLKVSVNYRSCWRNQERLRNHILGWACSLT